MKKILAIVLVVLLIISLSGCWDYEEYENLTQVYGMGIDYNVDMHEITVILEHVDSQKGGSSGGASSSGQSKGMSPKGVVHFATGTTIMEALEKIQQGIEKKLFYGYLSVLIIGEDAGKYITKDIFELVYRTPLIRTTADVIIAKGRAKDVLSKFDPDTSVATSQNISKMIKNFKNTGSAYPVTIMDFIDMMTVGGDEPVAPIISVIDLSKKKDEQNTNTDEEGVGMDHIMPLEQKEGHFYINNMAVFKGGNLLGELNEKESKGLVWVSNKNEISYVNISSDESNSSIKTMSFRIISSKSSIKPIIGNGSLTYNISVKVEAELRKYLSDGGSTDITPDIIIKMEEKLSDNIKSNIRAVLSKAQKEYKSDIFGFGNILYKESPKIWHEEYENTWSEVFPQVPVNVYIKAKVINTGTNINKFDVR